MPSCGECSASSAEMAGSLRSESTWAFTCRHLPTDWHDLNGLVRQLEMLVLLKQPIHLMSGRSIVRSQPVAASTANSTIKNHQVNFQAAAAWQNEFCGSEDLVMCQASSRFLDGVCACADNVYKSPVPSLTLSPRQEVPGLDTLMGVSPTNVPQE